MAVLMMLFSIGAYLSQNGRTLPQDAGLSGKEIPLFTTGFAAAAAPTFLGGTAFCSLVVLSRSYVIIIEICPSNCICRAEAPNTSFSSIFIQLSLSGFTLLFQI